MPFDREAFAASLILEETAPIPALQQELERLRGFDKEMEVEQGRAGNRSCLFTALFAASLVGAVFTMGITLVAAVPLLVLMIVWIRRYAHFSSKNTENRRYELVAGALKLLMADTGPESPVTLHLDLRPADRKETKQRDGKVGVWSVAYHEQAWLRMRGRLLDGTSWTVTATERLQVRRKSYRTSRGKHKTKTKKKSATVFGLALAPKEKRYGAVAGLAPQAQAALQLPAWAGAKRLEADQDGLTLKTLTKAAWDEGPKVDHQGTRLLGMMFLSLYQLLNEQRRKAA